MAGRFWDYTPILKFPLHWNDGGMVDGRLHNALALMLDEIISGVGDGHWKAPVASAATLPGSGNDPGDARITLDTGVIWVWNGSAWEEASSGALIYRGTWNANTNTPPLASGVGKRGEYYVVGVSGNTNLDGITDWVVGDWAVFNGTAWQKADHTDVVSSVFGRQGAVVAQAGDYSHAQIAGVGPDDHHAKSHAHDGLDGSGTVAHASLTGIGANDHHNRQHALNSAADHTGEITDTQHGNRGGGSLHPVVTPDPGGVAGFMSSADKTKLDGISIGAARDLGYQFGRNVRVPAGGTLLLYGPGSAATGPRLLRAGTITGASLQVDVVDAARTYDLQILVNGAISATLALPLNTLGVSTSALAVSVAVGDVITAQLVRTAGAGQSSFADEHAVVEVTF